MRLPGFGTGKLNIGTLFGGYMDFGRLDGLRFQADAGRTTIIVTTRWLMTEWGRGKGEKDFGWERLDVAFRDEGFYTRAIDTDAAIVQFAEIPLGTGTEKPAFAMLAGRTQDQPPAAPDEVFVAAVKGERAFVAACAAEVTHHGSGLQGGT